MTKKHEGVVQNGQVARFPIALDAFVCATSADNLNQILADTISLRDLYKKHHWQVSGPTFYQLHLLFDKHFDEQSELVAGSDDGTNDLLVSDVIQTNERQGWFVAEHLVGQGDV
jgi:DNA-binding ferritin-like protein (oxidative damage protectant)